MTRKYQLNFCLGACFDVCGMLRVDRFLQIQSATNYLLNMINKIKFVFHFVLR